jgi:hypothetical protein
MARKDLTKQIESALGKCVDQPSFFRFLLNDALEWPVSDAQKIEDISFGWSAAELQAAGIERQLVEGPIWQIQPLEQGQPWGIFVLEFKHADALSPRRGMAGVLRRVLRGLVASRRKDPSRPSWKREHLLFICTHLWKHFRFAYFRSKTDDSRTARLKSFGWGPGTSNRTVCEFNLPRLVWPDDPAKTEQWAPQWAEAFDKEPLTNDFFKRFDNALDKIKDDLQEYQKLESAEAYTQAQLLLERLIFLYFLQNRGWLNQDRHYLPNKFREYESKPDAFSYYKEFLDKVFWTLSSAPGSGGRLPGIPFLNGGLFDDDEFAQPADLRKTNPPLKVRNATFKYVFDELLEAFNFTVTEDTPLNQEVAVDPEMLGKVFESIVLHAEQADPDAVAPDKRKATGSYYTPRIVVHFICQEVLHQYLLNHLEGEGWGPRLRAILSVDASDGLDDQETELLKKTLSPTQAGQALKLVKPLRCCDPAVGSGAFPVGLLHELVNLRRVLETAANGYVDPASARGRGYAWLQETKEAILQNCLFGVDIQQQAIEICRLRLWLTLVVDYDLGLDPFTAEPSQFQRAIDGISQLPNLEMNFHRGDSLHDHVCGVPIVIVPEKASRYDDDFRAIAERGEKLHRAKKAEQKRKLRVEILGKRLDLSRRIVEEEIRLLARDDSALDKLFHDETESSAAKRKRIAQEKQRLEEALEKIEKDRRELEKLADRPFDSQFYVKLRKLEGADFNSPFNFAWYIDFPQIFAAQRNGVRGGFDIVVGNPPFVTARNPGKRQLWRERWPRVCHGKYHMLCPFLELSFGLLRNSGQLGFIISNAFAKREFGKPLVEDFLPTVDLQKIVDCSGLMFPGHGTPTCLIFGSATRPNSGRHVTVVGILPGGGDLQTPPEESELWRLISEHHDRPGFANNRICVSNRTRVELAAWPWTFDVGAEPTKVHIEERGTSRLRTLLAADVGFMFIVGRNDVFMLPNHAARRLTFTQVPMKPLHVGDQVRDYELRSDLLLLFPYDGGLTLLTFGPRSSEHRYFSAFEDELSNRPTFGGTFGDEGRAPYEFHQMPIERAKNPRSIALSQIATHAHFVYDPNGHAFNEKAPLVKLADSHGAIDHHLLSGVLNSSAALFWLKQVCFSKREAEEAEKDTYYEFQGNKVEQLPIPRKIAEALSGKNNSFAERLTELSQACWERGQRMPALALRKLFEKPGEAYHDWNSQLSGYVAPDSELGTPFDSTKTLHRAYEKAQSIRERLRAEMIALQEEMDWLVYAAYGLLREDHPAAQAETEPERLQREQRPFVLWAQAEGDYDRAVSLIPADWPATRRKLWEARLAAMGDNEHIRRIEQPVYKRRWDEQWKVGNQWRCGPVAYAAEFVEAFEWWLREKAEWWLEHKKNGGPVELDAWADALWRDSRVQAAWPVAAEQYAFLETEKAHERAEEHGEPAPPRVKSATDAASFRREFKRIIEDETIPAGFPFAVPYDELARKMKLKKVPKKLEDVRGKLNVPRERFHRHDDGTYSWAGLQFK